MFFNSFPYVFVFLPCVVLGFALLRRSGRHGLAAGWLIGASLIFYGWGDPGNLPVLFASLLFNYGAGRWMGPAPQDAPAPGRKRLFLAALAANVLFLCYYKYFGHHLPLGISFFTLSQVMYLVDCYEGLSAPNGLREHALFVTFFPIVTMGPITRARELLEQLRDPAGHRLSAALLARSLLLFAVGLFKKVVLADSFAVLAGAAHAAPGDLSMLEAWVGSVAYALQLYYDFSGYSDMALAAAQMLGLRIPQNFNSPFQARSIVDFWRRWHISLSNFITSYLYTPIIRSFRSVTFGRAMFATFAAMVIAGIWHGSTWNFALFGALHGLGLVVNQVRKKRKKKLPDGLAWLLAMAYVNFTMVFFRAPNLHDAGLFLRSMVNFGTPFGMQVLQLSDKFDLWLPCLLGVGLVFSRRNSNQLEQEFQPTARYLGLAALLMIVAIVYLNSNKGNTFVYLEF
jgi:D-alanyl-lipoteichoic acid acyltransferase DltB (MBOAT superfamily)